MKCTPPFTPNKLKLGITSFTLRPIPYPPKMGALWLIPKIETYLHQILRLQHREQSPFLGLQEKRLLQTHPRRPFPQSLLFLTRMSSLTSKSRNLTDKCLLQPTIWLILTSWGLSGTTGQYYTPVEHWLGYSLKNPYVPSDARKI